MEKKPEVFLCYAHEDEPMRRELEKHLITLRHEGLIDMWYDHEIIAGAEWKQEIEKHLNSAQVILLLISPDFMASEYCYDVEVVRAVERHKRGEALVIPIILRPVHWQTAPFGQLQVLPTDANPIISPYWHSPDAAFYDVTKGIRRAINTLSSSSPLPSSSSVAPPILVTPGSHRSRRIVLASIVAVATASVAGGAANWLFHLKGKNERPTKVATGLPTIKVATDFPISGSIEGPGGIAAENGAKLAVDEANAKNAKNGTARYKLLFEPKDDTDSSGNPDPKRGADNITNLVKNALVAGVVGPLNSAVAMNEMGIANKAPLAMISPSNTNQCLTQSSDAVACGGQNNQIPILRPTDSVTYFRIATTDDHQGFAMASYLSNTKNYKIAYVVDDDQPYGINMANFFRVEWEKQGGKLSEGHGKLTPSLLIEIASLKPDVIYFGGEAATGGTLLRQIQGVPTLQKTSFVGGDRIVRDAFAQASGLVNNPIFATDDAPSDTTQYPNASDFVKKYQSVYGAFPAKYSAASYDCMNILIEAIDAVVSKTKVPVDSEDTAAAKIFRQAVIDALKKTDYNGSTGEHSFDNNGDTIKKVIFIKHLDKEGGKYVWKDLAPKFM
jgi:branched-chain amino acid transport system substrate-binding protein